MYLQLRLGVMCLLSSVRVAPPVLEQFGAPDLGTQHQLRALHTAACLRISTAGTVQSVVHSSSCLNLWLTFKVVFVIVLVVDAGHHLMIIEAVRGTYYFETLPKLITAMVCTYSALLHLHVYWDMFVVLLTTGRKASPYQDTV